MKAKWVKLSIQVSGLNSDILSGVNVASDLNEAVVCESTISISNALVSKLYYSVKDFCQSMNKNKRTQMMVLNSNGRDAQFNAVLILQGEMREATMHHSSLSSEFERKHRNTSQEQVMIFSHLFFCLVLTLILHLLLFLFTHFVGNQTKKKNHKTSSVEMVL